MRTLLLALLLTGCGAGVQSVCGVAYSDNGAGAIVDAHSVSPLAFGSYKILDENTWQLEQGGFASAENQTCQFGVKDGHVYQ